MHASALRKCDTRPTHCLLDPVGAIPSLEVKQQIMVK
jgi:hypothetical protein